MRNNFVQHTLYEVIREPIARVIDKLKSERHYDHIIYMTPDGQQFKQRIANTLSLSGNIMILCGHYKGVDQRVRDHYITMEISIRNNFVQHTLYEVIR